MKNVMQAPTGSRSRLRIGRAAALIAGCFVAGSIAAADPAAAQNAQQRPPFVTAVEKLLELAADPTDARARTFADAHLTPQYRDSRPISELVAQARELGKVLGLAEIVNLIAESAGERLAVVRSDADGALYTLRFRVSEGMPPRIAGMTMERGGEAPGQQAPGQAQAVQSVTPAVLGDVLDALYDAVERSYVSPDTARLITAHLRSRHAAGAYRGITDPVELGRTLTTDLQAVNQDPHLSVSLRPAAGAGLPGAPDAAPGTRYGFRDVKRLPGNVGYIEVVGPIGGPDAAFDAAADALRGVADADAVILDLRQNNGAIAVPGQPGILTFMLSHFLPPDLHILDAYMRAGDRTNQIRTMRDVPGPRRTDVPLYILTAPRTASGGEFIAFVLQAQGRATIIGERTAGAGRQVDLVALPHGFRAGVSVSRTTDPRTARGWEVVGVTPDVEVPASQALETALRLAGGGTSGTVSEPGSASRWQR